MLLVNVSRRRFLSIWPTNSTGRFQKSLFICGFIISRGDSSGLERQSSYKHDTHKRTTSTAKAQLTVTMIFRYATALEKALQERKSKEKVADQHTSERERERNQGQERRTIEARSWLAARDNGNKS